jgi:hypothetical protein
VLFSLLKCVDLLFHTYLLGILLLSTYLAALLCQDAGKQVQSTVDLLFHTYLLGILHLPGCSTLPRYRHKDTESTVDLLFHTYLLGILLLSTYLAALLCQDAGTQVQRVQ